MRRIKGGVYCSRGSSACDERTVHQIGGTLGYDFGAARPALEIRVPVDEEVRDTTPYTLGLGVVIRR